jgi:hypothetical protein
MIFSLGLAQALPVQELGKKLIELRAEVEENGRQLQEAQRESSGRLESYIQRRTELETQVQKEHLRNLQLKEKHAFLKSTAIKKPAGDVRDYDQLLSWTADLEDAVRASLPFRRQERLATLNGLRKRIETHLESPVAIAGELWTLTEKELKLTADNEYLITKIDLDGQMQDAEIARIGMVQMMFKTSKGETGFAVRKDAKWTLVKSKSDDVSTAVARALTKFKERNSSGWFEVPGLSSFLEGSR